MFPKNTKILVVDDMNMFRKMVHQALDTLEFANIKEAHDGQQAWEMLESEANSNTPFGLVISDWNMPKMTGIDLLKKLRAQPWGANTPFIMLTAEGEKDNITQAIQARVDNYIVKPFTFDIMQQKLKQVHAKVSK